MAAPCPSCGADNPSVARFCSSCGQPLPSACPRCGSAVPDDARFCASCGQPLAEATGEERKVATAFFVDLVDSTGLGERIDAERLRAVQQSYFSLVSTTVAAWGGTIEKYVGDAVLAVFGVPRTREDDPARALHAALEIVDRFATLAKDVARQHGLALRIRTGVTTGVIVAPTEVRPDRPMVTGDAINVAARLQAAAEPGEIVVGPRTFAASAHLFHFSDPVVVQVKGRAEPIEVRRLLGRIAGAVETGPTRNMQARVVGRERELAILGSVLDEAIETRSPRLAVAYGVAGIGKSRLVREAVTLAAAERPDLTVLRGRCPAVGQGITYWPLAEIVRDVCGIALDDPASEAQAKLMARTHEILSAGGVEGEDAEATTFALATTTGIDLAGNPLDRSRPASVVTELARRWPQFLSALAARRPTIVVIEDLHWASEQLVDMVERLPLRSRGALMLVATARPEFAESHRSFGADRTEAVTISLRPLGRAHALGLLGSLLAGGELAPGLRDQILDTAEGNPLFLEEIVNRLVDAGTLERHDGEWRAVGDGDNVRLPDTISALLGARIDGLPDEERRVLREASVIGRIFWEAPVASSVGSATVQESLAGLERRGLISMRPASSLGGEVEYQFKHALIRDVAYAGISLARRARAHAAVAAWLGDLSAGPEELAALIAFHYRSALDEGADLAWAGDAAGLAAVRRDARTAFLLAGAAARKRFAIETAVELHEAAEQLSETDEGRADALEQIGDDHDAAYDGDQSVPAWERAIAIRRERDPADPGIARLVLKIARMGAVRWGGFTTPMDPAAIDRHIDAGLAAAPDDDTRAWLLVMRAATGLRWIAFHRSDPVPLDERVAAGTSALAYATDVGDVTLEANAVRTIAALQIDRGDVGPGLELTRSRLSVLAGIADPRERHLMTIENAQSLVWIGGDGEATVTILRNALRDARGLRVHDLCHSTGVLLNALYVTGRWPEIDPILDEHMTAFASDAAGTSCPFALGAFQVGATVLAHRGELERARELAARMPRSESPVGIVEALQAVALLATGEAAAARTLAATVLATGERNFAEEPAVELAAMVDALVALEDWQGLEEFLPEARRRAAELAVLPGIVARAEGLAAIASGDAVGGRKHLAAAVGALEGIAPFEAARAREALAGVDEEHRSELLDRAGRDYEALGARPHADRARSALGASIAT